MAQRRQPKYQCDRSILQTLAIYLLATAEDEDDKSVAMGVARLALQERKTKRNRKYGPRGSYNRAKSDDFFRLLLEEFIERQFKEWVRWVITIPDAFSDLKDFMQSWSWNILASSFSYREWSYLWIQGEEAPVSH